MIVCIKQEACFVSLSTTLSGFRATQLNKVAYYWHINTFRSQPLLTSMNHSGCWLAGWLRLMLLTLVAASGYWTCCMFESCAVRVAEASKQNPKTTPATSKLSQNSNLENKRKKKIKERKRKRKRAKRFIERETSRARALLLSLSLYGRQHVASHVVRLQLLVQRREADCYRDASDADDFLTMLLMLPLLLILLARVEAVASAPSFFVLHSRFVRFFSAVTAALEKLPFLFEARCKLSLSFTYVYCCLVQHSASTTTTTTYS